MPPKWIAKKSDPIGWLCAQQRPLAGLKKVMKFYYDMACASSMPDYLAIIDDDTFINPSSVQRYLRQIESRHNVSSFDPVALAGCKIRMPSFSFVHGGLGLILSRGLLHRLFEPLPVDMDIGNGTIIANYFGELSLFRPGMSLLDLLLLHAKSNPYTQHKNWAFPGYCVHSDWMWSVLEVYLRVDVHELKFPLVDDNIDDSASSIRSPMSQNFCRWEGTRCTLSLPNVPFCHYVTPGMTRSLYGRALSIAE
jgi:hypothetical protein